MSPSDIVRERLTTPLQKADFTFASGIYRDVTLNVVNRTIALVSASGRLQVCDHPTVNANER